MNNFQLQYQLYGERSILIEWPSKIDEEILWDILHFKESILQNYIQKNIQINHAYNSILITSKNADFNSSHEISLLQHLYSHPIKNFKPIQRTWKIPVCYDAQFGWDLETITREKNLTKESIISLHSEPLYCVYFIGFLPGFLYLGGLNEQLKMERKATPRLHIEKGAVAIGGSQTGIYPNESPGGWNVIGKSPIDFFDIRKSKPCFAKAGDRIQFFSIELEQYFNIEKSVKNDTYVLESEVIDG